MNSDWLEPSEHVQWRSQQDVFSLVSNLGVPLVRVSDTAPHVKHVFVQLPFKVDIQFVVAHSPWSNCTFKCIVKQVFQPLK